MANKKSIKGIAGDYRYYKIERYPLGTKAASLRNPYTFNDVPGNVVRFIGKTTNDDKYFFIPGTYTGAVLDYFNDKTTTDAGLFIYCWNNFDEVEVDDRVNQTFNIKNPVAGDR